MWAEPKVATWKNATGVEAFERLLWQEVKAKNWLEVEAHLASNFVYQDQQGRQDKQKFLSDLKETNLTDYTIGDLEVTANGTEAVVTYSAQFAGTFQGKGLPSGPVRIMTVWQQQKSGWVAVAMSHSR
jgi:hypothetical protein